MRLKAIPNFGQPNAFGPAWVVAGLCAVSLSFEALRRVNNWLR